LLTLSTLIKIKIKRSFDGSDKTYTVELPSGYPDNPAEGIEGESLVISVQDLKGIFDPVILRVLVLIQLQLEKIRKASQTNGLPLLLVGGFGSSEYLRRQIEAKFPTCMVIQPPDA
jgi:hypothetical protein